MRSGYPMSNKTKRNVLNLLLLTILLISVFTLPLSLVIPQASASTAHTVLTFKWSRSSIGTNWESGMVIGDVTGDGREDVVYCGGGSTGGDTIYVLDGITGDTIATYQNTRIGTYTQPQLYDVDNDGVLDILVAMYYQPSCAAIKYNGDATLQQLWITNTQTGTDPLGSIMAKPVAGDIDGDGFLDIFVASQDVSPLGGYDGTIVRLDHNGNILARTFTWRACSGGLALGDTDNDGEFELYQGDRDMDYSDGGYGKGVKSYWAANLTERWIRLDDLTSSQAPILVDVNGDGVKDVVTGMYGVMWVLNSTNGETISYWRPGSLSVHYGTTVYDIDGDGRLELLASDGDHDDQAYSDVLDLVTGQMDAQLSLAGGDWKWSPVVADIDPVNPGMEIICAPNGTSLNSWRGVLMIYGNDYQSIQNVTSPNMGVQMGFPVVQDIDGDGLLELVVCASSGSVYAFDTAAPAPGWTGNVADGLIKSERIRSEVTYYGEDRQGVAQHTVMPGDEDYWTAPLVAADYPGDNKLAIPISTSDLSFKLRDEQGDPVTYSISTMPNIGSVSDVIASGTSIWNELELPVSGLTYDTTYYWTITASDGSKTTTSTFTFRTELETPDGNSAPTQNQPNLTPSTGFVTSNFTTTAQGTVDDDDDNAVTNIYRWTLNGAPVNQVLLPFDTRSETSTKDYSGYGNDAEVIGAAWVSDGVVGGAYHFDGKDDAIVISDGGLGYFNDVDYPDNKEELGGFGDWSGVTLQAWVYLDEYTNGSTIIGKIPSYALGFTSQSSNTINRLYGAVWPYTGVVADDDNQASVDRMRSITANYNFELDTWYHIAFTYQDGVGMRLYVNGAQVASSTSSGGPLSPSRGEPVYIGRLVQPFCGMIDEVKIFNYALPAAQVQNEYENSAAGDSSSSKFMPFGIAVVGDVLACDVIPTDSYVEGTTRTSNAAEIVNSAPLASDLNIYPLRERDHRLTSEDLYAVYTFYDPDEDLESGSQIRWYKDDVLQTAYNDLTQVPASATADGQVWYFTVTPRDSNGDLGVLQTSPEITIRSNTAPVTGVPAVDSADGGTDYDDEELIATSAATTDADSDVTTNIFHWTNNGVSQTNLQMPFDTEVPLVPGSTGSTRDYSGYNNNGVVYGSTWVGDGAVGGALSFDGNDYVTVQENSNTLGGSGSWSTISVEFWVKASGATSTQTVVFKPDSSYAPGVSSYGLGYRVQYRSYADGYRVYWIVGNSTAQQSLNQRVIEGSGEWHHIVCTYESGQGLKIYTDGQLRGSAPGWGSINATVGGLLYLGGVNSGTGDFNGQLDEVRIYPKVLSAAQIFQRYIETKDGQSNTNTIVPQETAVGDNWVCQVTPNDKWADGTTKSSTPAVQITAGDGRPRIDWYSPIANTVEAEIGTPITFSQISSDPNGNPLSYSWTLDSNVQDTTANWTYNPATLGAHTIRVTISDGTLTDYQEWTVNVGADEMAYLVVRGSDNQIYYRMFNPISETWDEWGSLPGSTNDSPAATLVGKEFHVVVRGFDGITLYHGYVDLNTKAFSGWTWISGTTPSPPTLTSNGTAITLVVRGADNSVYYRVYSIASRIWGDWQLLPDGSTCDKVSAVMTGSQLTLIVRGFSTSEVASNNTLWQITVDTATGAYSGWNWMPGSVTSSPTLAYWQAENGYCLIVRGEDNSIYINKYYESAWNGWIALQEGSTNESPAATIIGNELHIVVIGMDEITMWQNKLDLNTEITVGWSWISGTTPSKPVLIS